MRAMVWLARGAHRSGRKNRAGSNFLERCRERRRAVRQATRRSFQPRNFMNTEPKHCLQARSLRADLLAAPDVWLPRREIVLEWLNAFLLRAAKPTYDLGETEEADLTALDLFLRKRKVPVVAA